MTIHDVPVNGAVAGRHLVTQYDAAGRVTSVQQTLAAAGASTVGIQYELQPGANTGRAIGETETYNGVTRQVSYTLDEAGNTTQVAWPSTGAAFAVTYCYDVLNRVQEIRRGGSCFDGTATVASYTYDAMSNRKTTMLGNGRQIQYGFATNGDELLTSVTHKTLIDTNNDGIPDTDAVWSFTYNNAQQVTSKTMPQTFRWDPTNPAADSYAPNALNQYASVDGNAYSYDPNGNLTARTVGTQPWTYTYDGENRLLSTGWTTGGVSKSDSYVYDAEDRRVQVTNALGANTAYVWSGQSIIAEYDTNGNIARRYIQGAGADEPVAMVSYDTSGNETGTEYYHADAMGSVVGMSDTTGKLVEHYSYSSYGEVGTEGVQGNPFRYTGRQLDPDTGLYYYRARYYAADIGRFLQTDPIGYADGMNWYAYTHNDPINGSDPTGTQDANGSGASEQIVVNSGSDNSAFDASFLSTSIQLAGATGNIFNPRYRNPYPSYLQMSANWAMRAPVNQGLPEPGLGNGGQGVLFNIVLAIFSGGTSIPEQLELEAAEGGLTAAEQLAANRAAGAAFEQAVGADLGQSGLTVGQQITIETESGVRTRLDFLTQDPLTGEIGCIECKASPTAPLTGNQTLAFPEIGESGGTIVGAGKPGFPGGTQIPPTAVQILRGP